MTQPTALWLADWLDVRACGGDNWNAKMNAAAAELRRLHAENEKLRQQPAFDALVAISLLTHLGGEVAEYADVVEAVRRLHALNGELLEALDAILNGHGDPDIPEAALAKVRATIARAEVKV
jgi:hypothetical protein